MNQSQSLSLVNREKLSQLSKIELVGIILAQQKVLEQLEREIEKLKISRDLDSQTSSKPPSTDLLKKPEQVKIDPEKNSSSSPKRKPGGQPGHQGQTRKGFSRTDRIEILQPLKCNKCGQRKFLAQPVKVDSQQVAQLVEQPIEVVEYHRYHCQCSECGTVTSAEWSPKMIPGQDLSVKLQAFLGWLGNYGHLPYKKQKEMLWELGQIEIGLGTLVNTNQRIDRAVAPSVNSLKNWIQQTQPNIHADETPWGVKGVKEWLWIVANRDFALFHAADTRSRAELETLLGLSYDGVLSSDDYSVYNGYDVKAQQKCLAHLRRHFKKLIKLPGLNNREIGQKFVKLIDEAFEHYAFFQQNQDLPGFFSWSSEFKRKVESSLNQWISKAGAEAGNLLRSLRDKAHQWWYFLDHPEVPPDNNLAERTLRLAVTKRKVSGGSRSMERFQDTANLLTVVQTCRRQGRSVIGFFEQAIQAIVNPSVAAPSLIPQI